MTAFDQSPPGRYRFIISPEQRHGAEVVLCPAETRHLKRVLRLAPGDPVEICDGQGHNYDARIVSREDTGARLIILGEITRRVESPLNICLGLALGRIDVFDLAVRQATEMGVNRLMPFQSTRAVVKVGRHGEAKRQRWQRLAREALKSSERQMLPPVEAPVSFAEILTGPEEVKIMCWEDCRCQSPVGHWQLPGPPSAVRLLIGPEGGFTAEEAAAAREAGFRLWSLGPRRLRVETAVLAALTLIQFLWGDLCLKS